MADQEKHRTSASRSSSLQSSIQNDAGLRRLTLLTQQVADTMVPVSEPTTGQSTAEDGQQHARSSPDAVSSRSTSTATRRGRFPVKPSPVRLSAHSQRYALSVGDLPRSLTGDWATIEGSTITLADFPDLQVMELDARGQSATPSGTDASEPDTSDSPTPVDDSATSRPSSWTPTIVTTGSATYVRQDSDVSISTHVAKATTTLPPPPQPRKGKPGGPPFSFWHEVLFVLVIAIAQALMLSGVAQALVPAGLIGSTFNLQAPADLAWFSASYALTSGTFVLPAGRLGDLFGHKRIFIVGFLWFAAWSFAAGFGGMVYESGAGNGGVVYFNFCRAMQGIGPALLVPNGLAMLGRAYGPGPRKNLVMSLFGAAAPFGFVVGGAMASLFAQLVSWPWAFWAMAVVCLVLGVVSFFVLPASTSPTSPTALRKRRQRKDQTPTQTKTKAKAETETETLWTRLDAPGILTGVPGLVLFNFAWNQAPLASWSTPYTYFLLVISLLLLGVFVHVERHAPHALLPIAAMRAHTNFVLACTAAGWGAFSVWVFYSFQFLETRRGWTPLLCSAAFAPAPLTGLAASLLTAYLVARIGPHWIMLVSMLAFAAGSVLMATAPAAQSYWANTFLAVLVMPFGMDMSNPAATILISNSVGREHQGIGASLVVTLVNYSISTALGFAATVEVHVNNGGADALAGYRGAQYFGVGLGGLGVVVALAFLLSTYRGRWVRGWSGVGKGLVIGLDL